MKTCSWASPYQSGLEATETTGFALCAAVACCLCCRLEYAVAGVKDPAPPSMTHSL